MNEHDPRPDSDHALRRFLCPVPLLATVVVVALVLGAERLQRLLPLASTVDGAAEKVVLLHGLGRTERAMLLLEASLRGAGYEVHNIGYPSREHTPEALLAIVGEEIANCCERDARIVHFVGHSLGGLLIRAYLRDARPEQLGRVVLLGAPNGGSELADAELHSALTLRFLEQAGPAAQALSTDPGSFPATLPPPDYPVGVIAGARNNAFSDQWLPIPNDGMVSVASARLRGATDFLIMDVSHWEMRNDAAVAEQVIAFLREGRFARSDS